MLEKLQIILKLEPIKRIPRNNSTNPESRTPIKRIYPITGKSAHLSLIAPKTRTLIKRINTPLCFSKMLRKIQLTLKHGP
jgi:hypothetical protein